MKYSVIKLPASVVCATILASCQSTVAPPSQSPAPQSSAVASEQSKPRLPTIDYKPRRVRGRNTLELSPGVFLHGNARRELPNGLTEFSGNVFLECRDVEPTKPIAFAYAEKMVWDSPGRLLTLAGSPSVEMLKSTCEGSPQTTMKLRDFTNLVVSGPSVLR
jgi:hypothetical protein